MSAQGRAGWREESPPDECCQSAVEPDSPLKSSRGRKDCKKLQAMQEQRCRDAFLYLQNVELKVTSIANYKNVGSNWNNSIRVCHIIFFYSID